ncbi:MAG: hypothetical protein ACK4IZ_07345 [Flavobacterium sp.]|uniref:hypothetical protein n=1 Tax=Flavobacterium sp. TaxID=239 RepID=UPI00391A7A93
MKIPKESIPDCYKYAKAAYDGKITADEATFKIHEKHGIKVGSAKDYPKLFKVLISGEGSLWGLSSYTYDCFLDSIYKDYGKVQLDKSLNTLMHLIKKYEGDKVGSKRKMRLVYEKYIKLV